MDKEFCFDVTKIECKTDKKIIPIPFKMYVNDKSPELALLYLCKKFFESDDFGLKIKGCGYTLKIKKKRKIDPVKNFLAAVKLFRNGSIDKTTYEKMVSDSMLKIENGGLKNVF